MKGTLEIVAPMTRKQVIKKKKEKKRNRQRQELFSFSKTHPNKKKHYYRTFTPTVPSSITSTKQHNTQPPHRKYSTTLTKQTTNTYLRWRRRLLPATRCGRGGRASPATTAANGACVRHVCSGAVDGEATLLQTLGRRRGPAAVVVVPLQHSTILHYHVVVTVERLRAVAGVVAFVTAVIVLVVVRGGGGGGRSTAAGVVVSGVVGRGGADGPCAVLVARCSLQIHP